MLDRFWVSKAEDLKKKQTKNKKTETKQNSQKESCFGALAWEAALKLKALLVGFNLLRLNPSPRIAHVLWNYRVWHDNAFSSLFLPFAFSQHEQAKWQQSSAEAGECSRACMGAWLVGPGEVQAQQDVV